MAEKCLSDGGRTSSECVRASHRRHRIRLLHRWYLAPRMTSRMALTDADLTSFDQGTECLSMTILCSWVNICDSLRGSSELDGVNGMRLYYFLLLAPSGSMTELRLHSPGFFLPHSLVHVWVGQEPYLLIPLIKARPSAHAVRPKDMTYDALVHR